MSILGEYLQNFWAVFSAMAPWLLLGYFLAGVIAYLLPPEQVKRHLSGKGFKPILKAVLLGVPLPLCSCGVIPVAASLREEGAGKGATGAFFISTPQTGIDNILVTWSMVGWHLALLRPVLALLSGLTGGWFISRSCPAEDVLPEKEEKWCCCCCGKTTAKRSWKIIFTHGFGKMLRSTSPSLLLGIAIAALIQQFLPGDFGMKYIAGNMFLEFAVVILLALPLYVCSNASVPIAAALLLKGFSPGAALVFLIAGPASSSVSIAAMKSTLGTKATVIALAVIAFWAVLAGVAVNCLHLPFVLPETLKSACCSVNYRNLVCGGLFGILMLKALWERFK